MPRFSIIVPIYNVEEYLCECLQSVLKQDMADWEAICIDDGSHDSSGAIADAMAAVEPRISVIHQPNRGLSAARNRGIEAAQGDYILFLDSDDWLETESLSLLNNYIKGQDMLCFGGWIGANEERMSAEHFASGWDYYNRHALEPRQFPFVCVVLRCYRRQFMVDANFRFREGILHEDNHFTPRVCLMAGMVDVIPHSLYHYRQRQGSIMTTRSLRSRQDLIRIANDLSGYLMQQDILPTGREVDLSVVYRALTHHYQVAFVGATRAESRSLYQLVDWRLYHIVSRTRLRHRLNYCLIRFAPCLYRWLNRPKLNFVDYNPQKT